MAWRLLEFVHERLFVKADSVMAASAALALATAGPTPSARATSASAEGVAVGDKTFAVTSASDEHGAIKGRGEPDSQPSRHEPEAGGSGVPPPLSILLALMRPASSVGSAPAKGQSASLNLQGASRPAAGAGLPVSGKVLPAEDGVQLANQTIARSLADAGKQAMTFAPPTGGDELPSAENKQGLMRPVVQPASTAASGAANAVVSLLHAAPPPQPQLPPQLPALNQPLGTPAWRNDFSQQVVWLAKHNVQAARLHLNPSHLGPIEVHIQLTQNQTQTQVWFHADNPATRAAMQASLPQLQQMFDQQGLGLAGAHVAAHGFGAHGDGGQTSYRESAPPAVAGLFGGLNEPADVSVALANSIAAVGLVDTYA